MDTLTLRTPFISTCQVVRCRALPVQKSVRISSPAALPRLSKRSVRCTASLSAAELEKLGPNGHGNVVEITSRDDFDTQIKNAGDKLVVLDVATKTCGPCKFIYPKVVEMSLEYPNVVFLKIFGDRDEGTKALMREWGVRAVPNFRFFRNGELLHSHTGAKIEDLKGNMEKFM
eukprot:TRINITY_DN54626_c0_g1_i1.p1 TRINITY_DN54626_c0_g1~~TRINITY_DN54626_c0_g1_i1.p1  ORF type:complete len:173 (-),score=13.36 TRINITY_DN54626_c0_g1_i1:243-761(-)